MKKILFRADAKISIGIGDLMSFVNLSRYFEEHGWECHFIVKDYIPVLALLNEYQIKNYLTIDKNSSIEQEIEIINNYLTTNEIKAIFLQINEVDLSHYSKIKNDIYKACVHFKENLAAGYNLVLSWDPDSHKYFNCDKYSRTKFFLGPEYVILSIDFDQDAIEGKIHNQDRKNLLLAMGGADEFDFTAKVIQKLKEMKCDMDLRIILGAGYNQTRNLEKILKVSKLKYQVRQNVKNMFAEYMACDVAIGTGGLTASELVYTRIPALLVAVYEHQTTRCKYFDQMGWVKYLGYRDIEKLDLNDLKTFIPKAKNRLSNRIKDVVKHIDGVCG